MKDAFWCLLVILVFGLGVYTGYANMAENICGPKYIVRNGMPTCLEDCCMEAR